VTVAHVRAPAAAPAPVLRIRLAATCAEAKPLHYLGTALCASRLATVNRVAIKQTALCIRIKSGQAGWGSWCGKHRASTSLCGSGCSTIRYAVVRASGWAAYLDDTVKRTCFPAAELDEACIEALLVLQRRAVTLRHACRLRM
jgi:hypothetical protein